MDMINI